MADTAVAFAGEDLQASLRRGGIARHALGVVLRDGVPELVQWRAAADQRLLVRREGLADIDEDRFVFFGKRVFFKDAFVTARKKRIRSDETGDVRRARSHLPRIEERADALRPQAVVGAVPAEP